MTEIEKQDPPKPEKQAWFGRLIAKDPRDKQYSLSAISTARQYRYWNAPPVLDQGPTPYCVAYASCGWLWAGPVKNTDPFGSPTRADAYAGLLYREAQDNDEWPGSGYDGTSVRGAFKVLKARGFIPSYRWAEDAEVLAQHILEIGPAVVGTDWTFDMSDPDDEGFIHYTGDSEGGHAWLVTGFSRQKRAPDGNRGSFRMQNSWGWDWGERGRAWVSFEDMEKLIANDGEAVAALELDLDAVRRLLARG